MAVLKTLKIATRQSPLALWQANFVKDQLEKFHPTLSVELVPMVTKGDVILVLSLEHQAYVVNAN